MFGLIVLLLLILHFGDCLTAFKGFRKTPLDSFPYSGKQRPGVLSPKREVPIHIQKPEYAITGLVKDDGCTKVVPTAPEDIELMRKAGILAREVLDIAVKSIKSGICTDEIDRIVHEATIARDCYPSPLNYRGFPKSCCTSINEVICHGIPDTTTKLIAGDAINIDITVFYKGVHGDCSETVIVDGPQATSPEIQDLVRTTYESLQLAIDFCKPGRRYSDIGGIIEQHIKKKGYSTVEEFCGHGIGRHFHTLPNVLHYKNNKPAGLMAEGHTFTIEPMICLGSNKHIFWRDTWTATTTDGKASAQFEHTLLITSSGVDILTGKLPSSPKFFWE